MFRLESSSAASFPAKRETESLGRVSIPPPSSESYDRLNFPEKTRKRLDAMLSSRRASASRTALLAAEDCAFENRHGVVLPVLSLRGDEAVPGLLIHGSEEEYEECSPGFEVYADDEEFLFPDGADASGIWHREVPVEQRRSEVRTGPNKKCPCGSGRKHKRCCGRV